jgi:glycosyltransferase involved in cell wall biosynthesis
LDKSWARQIILWEPGGLSIFRFFLSGVRQKLFQQVPSPLWRFDGVAERAVGRVYPELVKAAASTPADLYIGHYPTGFAAAARAAEHSGAKLGYDAEDYHTGEPISPRERARIEHIERRYLRRCAYVTAASPGIATALAEKYALPKPQVIYNTFPWSERERLDGKQVDRTGPAMSLYWFSQWVGLDRGLQDAIRAIDLLGGRVQLHIRGSQSAEVQEGLVGLAKEVGVHDCLHFHPQVAPGELVSRATEHDIGLALEPEASIGKAIAASNKLFLYMLAGLALAASDVPGQRAVLESCPSAGVLYTPGDYRSLAEHLARWQSSPRRLAAAKAAALAAARERWNWEVESRTLVRAVRSVLQDVDREPVQQP